MTSQPMNTGLDAAGVWLDFHDSPRHTVPDVDVRRPLTSISAAFRLQRAEHVLRISDQERRDGRGDALAALRRALTDELT